MEGVVRLGMEEDQDRQVTGVGFFCMALRVEHTVSLARRLRTEEYAQISRSSYARHHVSDASSSFGNGRSCGRLWSF